MTRLPGCSKANALAIINYLGLKETRRVGDLSYSIRQRLLHLFEILNRGSTNTPLLEGRYFYPARGNRYSPKGVALPVVFTIAMGDKLRHSLIRRFKHFIRTKHRSGSRHLAGLPVRGQRTSSNAHTQRRIGRVRVLKLLGT